MKQILKPFLLIIALQFTILFHIYGEDVVIQDSKNPAKNKVTIAIVKDGYSRVFDDLFELLKVELKELSEDVTFVFKESPEFDGAHSVDRLKPALENALNDPEVDMVYTPSFLITMIATKMDLKKPVISGFVQKADFFGHNYATGKDPGDATSNIKNLSFVLIQDGLVNDIKEFQKLIHFKKLHILVDNFILKAYPQLVEETKALAQALGLQIILVPVDRVDELLSQLGEGIEAIYLTTLSNLSQKDYQDLIDGINEKKIPTFSMMGHEDVARGVLAGLTPELLPKIARRIALNLNQIAIGESPNNLPVFLILKERLLLNMLTAQKIGIEFDIKVLLFTDTINEDLVNKGAPITLDEAMKMGMDLNVDVDIAQDIMMSQYEQQQVIRHKMFPHLFLTSQYNHIDRPRALVSGGVTPIENVYIGFQITQMLFDDELITAYYIAGKQWEKDWFDEEQISLDKAEQAANNYLNLIFIKNILDIQEGNFKLVLQNLDLAHVRERVGVAGLEEVYRWETAEAQNRAQILQQKALIGQAEAQLSQTIGGYEANWDPERVTEESKMPQFFLTHLIPIINTESKISKFREFSIQFAFENDPALQAYDRLIEAQIAQMKQIDRSFIVPKIYANFTYNKEVARRSPLPRPKLLSDEQWLGQINLIIPFFDGDERTYKYRQAYYDLERLINSRLKVEQLIVQRIWTVIYKLESSLPRIKLTKIAAEKAKQNLVIVQNKYSEGSVSIVDLIDAQTQLLDRSQDVAIALNQYLLDLIAYQRSISWFVDFQSEENKMTYIAKIKLFLDSCRDDLVPGNYNWLICE